MRKEPSAIPDDACTNIAGEDVEVFRHDQRPDGSNRKRKFQQYSLQHHFARQSASGNSAASFV